MPNDKILVKDDITDEMQAKVVMARINEVIRPSYNLRDLTRAIDTGERIHISYPLTTKRVQGQRDVKELQEAAISSQAYDHIDETLHKNVTHIVLSAESQLSAEENIWSMHVDDSALEIANMENQDVSDVLDDMGSELTGVSDWSDNDNDPYVDIMDAATMIREEHLDPNVIAMEPGLYAEFVSNQNIVDRFERGRTVDGSIASIAGLDIMIDTELPDDTAYVLDTAAPAMVLADGPRMIGEYTNQAAMFDGYVIADFLHVEDVIDEAVVYMDHS